MNLIRTINIVGGRGDNPSVLRTRLEPIKLEENMGIVAQFIAFGEVANITGDCSFQIRDHRNHMNITLRIPEGRYTLKEDVLLKVADVVNDYILQSGSLRKCTIDSTAGKFTITPPATLDILINSEGGLWKQLNVHKNNKAVWLFTGVLEERTGMAFIYMNIVENSYINGKKSRVLTAFPVTSKSGYTYHEFTNSTYVPIQVKEFSEIEVEIRNLKGELLKIDNSYDTIISLHLSPINSQR